jgi:hypothetical protein
VLPSGAAFSWPDWWPVESKARTTENGCADARREALTQLSAYWSILVSSRPDLIGFGIIMTLRYWPPREVRASIILPAAQRNLAREFANTPANADIDGIQRHLYAC